MTTVIKKVEGGKLFRLDFELENQQIKSLKLTGDFFLHPEEAIKTIEEDLLQKNTNQIEETIKETLEKESATLIGVEPKDIEEAITNEI